MTASELEPEFAGSAITVTGAAAERAGSASDTALTLTAAGEGAVAGAV